MKIRVTEIEASAEELRQRNLSEILSGAIRTMAESITSNGLSFQNGSSFQKEEYSETEEEGDEE